MMPSSLSRFLQWLLRGTMVLLLAALSAPAFATMVDLDDEALSEVTGQALLVSDKIAGTAGSNMMFYRMTLDAKLEMNMSIDRLQLGCGGYNDSIVNGACDIDLDYVTMMGRVSSGGQAGAVGSGTAATSLFTMTRPYIEIGVINDGDSTRRQIVGFKIGAQSVDGYMGIGRYDTSLAGCNPSATSGAGAYYCHQGINRISGYLGTRMQGNAYGCFGLFGCTPNANPALQDRIASFDSFLQLWGTRMNRAQVVLSATSNPDVTIGLTLTVNSNVNQSLRFLHGFSVDPTNAEYAKDDFFISFQREPVEWPTFNKTGQTASGGVGYSYTANPGWWMNVPYAALENLNAYGVVTSGGSLFVPVTLADPDVGQRPPDNCWGSLKFC